MYQCRWPDYYLKALIAKRVRKAKNFVTFKNKFGYAHALKKLAWRKAGYYAQVLQRKMDQYEVPKSEMEVLRVDVGLIWACIDMERTVDH